MKRSILNFTILFLLDDKIEILLKHVDRLKFSTFFCPFAKFFRIFQITFFAIFKIIILFKKIIIIWTSSQQWKCYYNFSVQHMLHRKSLKTQENACT